MKKELSTLFNTRQYMEAENFEIFYYHDVDLKHISAHLHNYYEFYFFLEGNADYEIDGKCYSLQYGDFLLIPPGIRHRPIFKSKDMPYRRFVLWFNKEYYEHLCALSSDFAYGYEYVRQKSSYHFRTDSITFWQLQGRLMDMIEEMHSTRAFSAINSHLMVTSFLVLVNRIIYEMNHKVSPSYENALYLSVCDYINNHLSEELSLDKLASFFYVSKFHISHIFKENMGISVHQYILKKRLQASKNTILSGETFSDVVSQYGFNDYTSFYRAFKKEFGLSPKEYREQYRLPEVYP